MKIIKFFSLVLTSFLIISGNSRALMAEDNSNINWKEKDNSYWKGKLSPDTYRITREAGTEAPFTGKYNKHYEEGTYTCSNCGQVLFSSDTKFDSGSGWPSFSDLAVKGSVELKKDQSHGMTRTEALCSRCGAHLGHVFDDGPSPTGKRYCINSASLEFEKEGKK